MKRPNKLERLLLASYSRLVKCFLLRPKLNSAEHLLGTQLIGRLLALLANIRLGREGLIEKNSLLGMFITYSQKVLYHWSMVSML